MLPMPLLLLLADRLSDGGTWRDRSASDSRTAQPQSVTAEAELADVEETGQRPRGNVDGRLLSAAQRNSKNALSK